MLIALIGIIALAVGGYVLYIFLTNKIANNKVCKSCKKPFNAKDIIGESLVGDGVQNSGKMRKLSVNMRCSICEREQTLIIYTEYRHSPSKGSPAYQYFKDLEREREEKQKKS